MRASLGNQEPEKFNTAGKPTDLNHGIELLVINIQWRSLPWSSVWTLSRSQRLYLENVAKIAFRLSYTVHAANS